MADSATKTLEPQPPQSDTKPIEEEKPREEDEGKSDNLPKKEGEENDENDEEEEVGECGFCLYMKGGGCKESFTAWEQCVEESEKNKEDIAEKCFEITSTLKKCMEAHADYYEPILRAEKAAEAEAVKELENDKAAETSHNQNAAATSDNSEQQHSGSSGNRDA